MNSGFGVARYSLLSIFLVCVQFESSGQNRVEFQVISKTPAFSGVAIGFAANQNSLFVRDWERYYLYSFAANTWTKLNYVKAPRILEYAPKTLSFGNKEQRELDYSLETKRIPVSYLPTFGKILTMSTELEAVDITNFRVSQVKFDGGIPFGSGCAAWREKVYYFGGLIIAPAKSKLRDWDIEFSGRLLVFDPARLSLNDLARMPAPLFSQGLFVGDYLYVIGCGEDHLPPSMLLRYDPVGNSWETMGTLSIDASAAAIAAWGTKILVLGTRDTAGFLIVFDKDTKQITEYPSNMKWKFGAAWVRENTLYYFGGVDIDFPRSIARELRVLDLAATNIK